MTSYDFMIEAKKKVADYLAEHHQKPIEWTDVIGIRQCRTLQNQKIILAAPTLDELMFEVTYDENAQVMYFDAYAKVDHCRYDYGTQRDVEERPRRVTSEEIVVGTREEAESICRELKDAMQKYGYVTMEDFHCIVGVHSQYTDRKWGWKSFGDGYPNYESVPGGYRILMPRVEAVLMSVWDFDVSE